MPAKLRSVAGVGVVAALLLVARNVRDVAATLAETPDRGSRPAATAVSSDQDLLVHYAVPGNPYSISVEAPGRVWFTMPEQNLIGRLVVTSTADYEVVTYTVPTANGYPYDLVYASGAVWFTEQEGNKIGRLDASLGTFDEFIIPTPSSTPTGIDALPGMPTHVWFTERSGDRLGHLVYTSTVSAVLLEHPVPADYGGIGAELEDVSALSTSVVWLTAPGIGYIARFNSGMWSWRALPGGGEPWSIQVAEGGLPIWFTDRSGDRIGAYYPTTIADFLMYSLPTSGAAPSGIVLADDKIWITELLGERVTRLQPWPLSTVSYGVRSGSLCGIDADSDNHLWFAECEASQIGEWRPPYLRFSYLPFILKGH